MSIFTHAAITWTNDTVNNLNTFNQEIKEKMTDIDTAIAAEVVARNAIIAAIYPIGSLYITTISTNPATVLGFGTWTAFGAGRTLVGLDATADFNTVEKTGGEKTHTLITAEMPAHTHTINAALTNGAIDNVQLVQSTTTTIGTSSTGGGGAHNNLPPYIVVYFFKRIS